MLTRLLRLLAFLTRWRPLQNPRPPGRGLLPRLGERPAPSSAAGVRWQSLQGAAALSPLLGERQNLPQPAPDAIRGTQSGVRTSSAELGKGSSGRPPQLAQGPCTCTAKLRKGLPRGCPAPWRPRGRPAVPARPQPSSPTRQKNSPKLSLASRPPLGAGWRETVPPFTPSQFPPPGPPPQPCPLPLPAAPDPRP